MTTEAQRRANMKYEKNNVAKRTLRLYPDDADVLARLDAEGRDWAKYLKRLVREDMERNGGASSNFD